MEEAGETGEEAEGVVRGREGTLTGDKTFLDEAGRGKGGGGGSWPKSRLKRGTWPSGGNAAPILSNKPQLSSEEGECGTASGDAEDMVEGGDAEDMTRSKCLKTPENE